MKLETLNVWGGKVYEPLMDHIQRQSQEGAVDIFCFQEVYDTSSNVTQTRGAPVRVMDWQKLSNASSSRANGYSEIALLLPHYQGFFHPIQSGRDFYGTANYDLHYGQAMFVRKTIPVSRSGEVFVHGKKDGMVGKDWDTLGRNIEYVSIEHEGREFTIVNFHGIHGKEKRDTSERLVQAQNIRDFLDMKRQTSSIVLCGDFNLRPDTESMAIIGSGLRDLVGDFGVMSTRSEYYDAGKPVRSADYIFVSPEITVVDFRVLSESVSDHLPLELTFEAA